MTTRQSEPDGEKGDLLKRIFMLIATIFILSATTIIVLASGAFNGEGEPSPVRSTCADGLDRWDPKPEEKFRRYCTSHEYGYPFYDFWHDYLNRKTKEYPD